MEDTGFGVSTLRPVVRINSPSEVNIRGIITARAAQVEFVTDAHERIGDSKVQTSNLRFGGLLLEERAEPTLYMAEIRRDVEPPERIPCRASNNITTFIDESVKAWLRPNV